MKTKLYLGLVVVTIIATVLIQYYLPKKVADDIPVAPDQCVVTINNQKYDVTNFRKIHKGGDVFECGSDISNKFAKQHPISFLDKIADLKL